MDSNIVIDRKGQIWISTLENIFLVLQSLDAKAEGMTESHVVAWICTDIPQNHAAVKNYISVTLFENNKAMKRLI